MLLLDFTRHIMMASNVCFCRFWRKREKNTLMKRKRERSQKQLNKLFSHFLYKNNHECCWDYKWETKTLKLFVIITIPDHSLPTSGPASGSCLIQPKEKETKKKSLPSSFFIHKYCCRFCRACQKCSSSKVICSKVHYHHHFWWWIPREGGTVRCSLHT